MTISIIIPALNEAAVIVQTLSSLQPLRTAGHEVILVDGESEDATVDLSRPLLDRLIRGLRGRGRQMNAGARVARGEILLFLHADTLLPEDADRLIREGMKAQGRRWGRFDVRLSGTHPTLRIIEVLMNLRSRLTGIATGDQAIFVQRELFEAAGGFPDIDLMEDIALSKILKRHGCPLCLRQRVLTSSCRWETNGILRTVLLMWRLRLSYLIGSDPAHLARLYPPSRKATPACRNALRRADPEPFWSRAGTVLAGGSTKRRKGHDMNRSDCCLVLFARAPVPGGVKTRLIPLLGEEGAAVLYERMLIRSIAAATNAALGPVELWCAPSTEHPFFSRCAERFGVTLLCQTEGDIGERMAHAFRETLKRSTYVLLMGTDCPSLTGNDLGKAVNALREGTDAVLAPSEDGGYVLMGLRRYAEELFTGIAWGTEEVLEETRIRLRHLGWRWHELLEQWDVDRPEDVERLKREGYMEFLMAP